MEPSTLFANYGLEGAIIAVLIAAVAAMWRRLNQVTDARVDDQKKHSEQIISATRDIGRAVEALDGINRRL